MKVSEAGVVHLVKGACGEDILGSKRGGLKGPEAGEVGRGHTRRTVVACWRLPVFYCYLLILMCTEVMQTCSKQASRHR